MADSLLQEVDEALRADRAAALWEKHKRSVIAALAALVLGAAIHSGYQHYRESHGGKVMAALVASQQLLDSGKAEDAAKGFAAIADANGGELKSLALVWQSRALLASGKKGEAVKALTTASAGSSLWSDVACLRLAGLDGAAAKACLNSTENSPLAAARAQWAAAGNWEAGDVAAAKASLEKLVADESTNQETRTQLTQWLAVMKDGKK